MAEFLAERDQALLLGESEDIGAAVEEWDTLFSEPREFATEREIGAETECIQSAGVEVIGGWQERAKVFEF